MILNYDQWREINENDNLEADDVTKKFLNTRQPVSKKEQNWSGKNPTLEQWFKVAISLNGGDVKKELRRTLKWLEEKGIDVKNYSGVERGVLPSTIENKLDNLEWDDWTEGDYMMPDGINEFGLEWNENLQAIAISLNEFWWFFPKK
jgi:hypothetical protein